MFRRKRGSICSGTGGPVSFIYAVPTCPVCGRKWPLRRTIKVPRHRMR